MTGTPAPRGATWVVLPTYNEAQNLPGMAAAICGILGAAAGPAGYRLLVVDDGSPDGTGAIADELATGRDEIEVLHRTVKEGLGRAYIAGFERALASGAGLVIEMDADFSHDPAQLAVMLDHARAGADLVLGSRYVPGGAIENWSRSRRLLSRAGCLYAQLVLRVPVRDLTGGFKCFRADALRTIDYASVRSTGYAFQIELTYRALRRGLRVVETPIVFRERREGHSKMSRRIAAEAIVLVPALRAASLLARV